MMRRLLSYSCIFLFSAAGCTSAPKRAVKPRSNAPRAVARPAVSPTPVATSVTSDPSDASPPPATAPTTPTATTIEVATAPIASAARPVGASRARSVRRPTSRHDFQLGYVSWPEDTTYSLAGQKVILKSQLQGFQIGYVYSRASFWLALSFEALQAQVSERDPLLNFQQQNVPTYAAGLGVFYPFFVDRASISISIGARVRGRLMNLQKVAAEDEFVDRMRFLPSVEVPLSWAFSNDYALSQSLGWIAGPSGLVWEFSVRRKL